MCMDIKVNDCCCVDLKTGCFVIGYTGLMLTGSSLLYIGYTLTKLDDIENADIFLKIVLYVVLAFCILHFIFSSCLILGVHKNSRGWIKAYIVYLNIFIGNQIISLTIQILSFKLIEILISLPLIILMLYILGVVNSYHKELAKKPTVAVIDPVTGPVVNNCTPNNTPMAAVTNPATGPVDYGSPSDVYTAAVTGPVGLGAPNNGYTAANTGPVGYGAPNYGYTTANTGPLGYGAPNNGYIAANTGPDGYGAPINGPATAPVDIQ